jgi:hypothetical protein
MATEGELRSHSLEASDQVRALQDSVATLKAEVHFFKSLALLFKLSLCDSTGFGWHISSIHYTFLYIAIIVSFQAQHHSVLFYQTNISVHIQQKSAVLAN